MHLGGGLAVRKAAEVEIGESSVVEAGEDEVYAAATHAAEAFAEETSAAVAVLLGWLGLDLIDLELEEPEDYCKEAAETGAANVRGKEGFGGSKVRIAAIEAPHDESPRKDGFASVHQQEKRPD